MENNQSSTLNNQLRRSVDPLMAFLSSTIQGIDRRLSSAVDVVHHNKDDKSQERYMPQIPTPARRPVAAAAAPVRRAAPPPPDDDLDFREADLAGGTEDEFADFDAPPPPPARGTRRAAPPPPEDDLDLGEFDGPEGTSSDDPNDADFAEGGVEADPDAEFDPNELDPEADSAFAPEPEPEPVVEKLHPKLKDGTYIIPKGVKAWQVGNDRDGNYIRTKVLLDNDARAVKATYTKKDHNYPVVNVEDKPGKATFVVLAAKDSFYVVALESLLNEDKTPAQQLKPRVAKTAPVAAAPARRGRPAAEPVAAAPTLSKAQVKAVQGAIAALNALADAFPEVG